METPTPETDALFDRLNESPGESAFYQMHEHAQKLERERDEARLQRDQARREAEASQDCKWPKYPFSWWGKDKD